MRFFILILLTISGCSKRESDKFSDQTVSENSSATAPATVTEEFMELVNKHRKSLGKAPLEYVPGLGDVAYYHSEDMASGSSSFGHDGFSARCADAKIIIDGGNLCGENVARGQKTAEAAFNSWMNSEAHRAHIENSRYSHTGFGYAKASSGTYYWTQIFLEGK